MVLPNAQPEIEELFANFICDRMDIFWSRVAGLEPPYSDNPIFLQYKFTNVYRVTDRVSQYLIRNVQYNQDWSPEDLIFRTILFKHFNLPSTWEGLVTHLKYPITLGNFDFNRYCKALDSCKPPVYNNAYMTAWVRDSHKNKAHGYLKLFEESVFIPWNGFIDSALKCQTFPELYEVVAAQPYVGDFLAYQYATDLNYTNIWQFDEDYLCLATVGSKRGIEKLLGYRPDNHAEVIRFYTVNQEKLLEEYGLLEGWCNLFGRRLHNIDVQNCFCELDKYLRAARPELQDTTGQGKRIKNRFKKTPEPYTLMFPSWWNISDFNNQYEVS